MASQKGFCEDLTEGKFSFPVIHALRASAIGCSELEYILRAKTQDNALKARAVVLMHNAGSFDYTRSRLAALQTQAQQVLAELGGENRMMVAILRKLKVE